MQDFIKKLYTTMSSHFSQVILTRGGLVCLFLDAPVFKSILCMHVQFVSHTDISLVVEYKENKDYQCTRLPF